jgi:hypothetical protein
MLFCFLNSREDMCSNKQSNGNVPVLNLVPHMVEWRYISMDTKPLR